MNTFYVLGIVIVLMLIVEWENRRKRKKDLEKAEEEIRILKDILKNIEHKEYKEIAKYTNEETKKNNHRPTKEEFNKVINFMYQNGILGLEEYNYVQVKSLPFIR